MHPAPSMYYGRRPYYNRLSRHQWINHFRESEGCVKCGSKYYKNLYFYDKESGRPVYISTLISYPEERMEWEIAKCDIMCFECHRGKR